MNRSLLGKFVTKNYRTLSRETTKDLRIGVWVYFFLLIFEGALRKWIFPQWSTPLLVVRDPLAIWMLFRAWQIGLFPTNAYVLIIFVTGVFSFIVTMFLGHGNVIVAIYGLRLLCLHFPLIFIIGRVFEYEDVLKIGKVIILLAIPMVALNALQFFSPESAWVRQGVGGTGSAAFPGALGYFRPSGTFSFTNGNVLFWGMAAPFLINFWLKPRQINPLLLIFATGALLLAIPLSISRALFLGIGVTIVFALFILLARPAYLLRISFVIAGILILFIFFEDNYIITKSVEVFEARFTTANEAEGGLVEGTIMDRFFGGLAEAFTNLEDVPLLGDGLGKGTQAGAKLLTGERAFLIAEGEWSRIIGEMGLLLGTIFILLRLAFVIKIGVNSFKKIGYNNYLPWLLLSFAVFPIAVGQWGQPTVLGFAILTGGLILGALKE